MNLVLGIPDHPFFSGKFNALRRLPPGTALQSISDHQLQTLREELFALPPGGDLSQWLQQHRPDAITLHALRWVVNLLSLQAQGTAQALRAGMPIELTPEARVFFANAELFGPEFNSFDDGDAAALASRLRLLQTFPLLREEADPQLLGSSFLHQLFGLSPDVEPLEWIRTNHLETASELALKQIINQSIPLGPQQLGRVTRKIDISRVQLLQVRDHTVRYELDRLQLTENGFKLSGSFEVEGIADPDPRIHYSHEWQGLDSVEDNLGAGYFAVSRRNSSSGTPYVKEWEIGFYPALQPGTTSIRIGTEQARVSILRVDHSLPMRPPRGPQRELIEVVELGNIVTTIEV